MRFSFFLSVLLLASTTFSVHADSTSNTKQYPQAQNRKFAETLYTRIHYARNATGEDIPTLIKNEFAKHLGINVTDPDYQTKITQFWNANQNDFICSGKIQERYRES